jgi:hypothetical protein
LALTDFALADEIDPLEYHRQCHALKLPRQSQEEIYEMTYALRLWRDLLEERSGSFSTLRHRYDGDDPPDFQLLSHNAAGSSQKTIPRTRERQHLTETGDAMVTVSASKVVVLVR